MINTRLQAIAYGKGIDMLPGTDTQQESRAARQRQGAGRLMAHDHHALLTSFLGRFLLILRK
jgi:hypothetical protein